MTTLKPLHRTLFAAGLLAFPSLALAFTSGSTGADGALNPAADTELQVPPSGVFNFTSVNIPAGVKVSFKRNASNTPVTLLVFGNATIAGILDVSGGNAVDVGTDGNILNSYPPGKAGSGGYDGGIGGVFTACRGSAGLGPGGGNAGFCGGINYGYTTFGGAGGSYASSGQYGGVTTTTGAPTPGSTYGSSFLKPLLGGSGGGGGSAGSVYPGASGGGGGGAILLAVSGTASITGSILANGGKGGAADLQGCSSERGAGGGGG